MTGCAASTSISTLPPDSCLPLKAGNLQRGDVEELKNKVAELKGEYDSCAKAYHRAREAQ